jgi:hypothetical protein
VIERDGQSPPPIPLRGRYTEGSTYTMLKRWRLAESAASPTKIFNRRRTAGAARQSAYTGAARHFKTSTHRVIYINITL